MPLDGHIARWRPRASPANAEVLQPDEPATPAVPDAPITPAVPDPGTPTEPEDPATVPTPDEPATPIAPNPDPDVTATTPSVADVSLPTEHLKSDCKNNQLHAWASTWPPRGAAAQAVPLAARRGESPPLPRHGTRGRDD